ncbi:MAG: 4Fe-4S dicluster domain-containing protein, partial [Acidobacteria bacterium]|nr:4Fe-4S dicluster domain-containing protein [Acidobacteriota bacterium]
EFFEVPTAVDLRTNRRGFLAAAGFGLAGATMASCSRAPIEEAIPLLVQPEAITPGRASFYSSTCAGCSAGCGLIVKSRDGRPIKLEGNPDHPVSRGGVCALGQASILGLYDSQRLGAPTREGQPVSWEDADRDIVQALDRVRQQGGAVRVLTGTLTSPTTRVWIGSFLRTFTDARHVSYDALSASAVLDAHEQTHGARVLPRYRFDRAEVIVGVDADFLGTWISPVEYTAGYRSGRVLDGDTARLSYHVQVESRMSLTGAKADHRLVVAPADAGLVLAHLADRVARLAGTVSATAVDMSGPSPVEPAVLDEVAARLWAARARGLVVCGVEDPALQIVCNTINHTLGAYGTTIDVDRPSFQRAGSDRDLEALLGEIAKGTVAALVIAGVNPVYELPGGAELAEQLKKLPLVISLADHVDETSSVARYVCPDSHFLESWGDAEPVAGLVSVTQPLINAMGGTRPFIESLAAWSGTPGSAYALLRESWTQAIHPRRLNDVPFDEFWDRAVHDGFVEVQPAAAESRPFVMAASASAPALPRVPEGAMALVLYPKVAMLDGRGAQNPWLHELPDPISKVTWDNYACLSPAAAARLGVIEGDVVRVETGAEGGQVSAIDLPVYLQPGQHDTVVAIALGYGRMGTERFATVGPQWFEARPTVGDDGRVGRNVAPFARWSGGTLRHSGAPARLSKTGRRRALAVTQSHHSIDVPANLAPAGGRRRPIVHETTLAAYQQDPTAGSHGGHESEADLWPPDHQYPGHRWKMVIDLTACTGCSACVIACQAENNVAVVGRDEVMRHREMHWMRIDRYYADRTDGGVDVLHQPMLCQHCENASCETVCPVLATVHSEEGLNQQVYNRCVGTRYCANNCAYKVRRFNWFHYAREDRLQNLALNPDVVVRSRGVMEKCSFCVQRIENAKLEAKRLGEVMAPDAVQTACQQTCPAQAIVFGDANNPDSRVARLMKDPRHYRVLEDLNVGPSVGYLTLVRNRAENEAGGETNHE